MPTPNERIAEVEVLFRAGNERMMEWTENRERAARGEQLVFFCECGRRGCKAQVRLTGAQYEGVRADARRFVIAPGHEFREAEDVVEEHEGYVVVQSTRTSGRWSSAWTFGAATPATTPNGGA